MFLKKNAFFYKKVAEKFGRTKKTSYLCIAIERQGNSIRAISSAGSEHLPYKQRVGGSNPSSPTKEVNQKICFFFCYIHFYTAQNWGKL